MSKRAANLSEASLPQPPPPDRFIAVLKKWQSAEEGSSEDDPINGTGYQAGDRPVGTRKTECAGVQSFLSFAGLCQKLKVEYGSLDRMLVAWAKWVIKPDELTSDTAGIEGIKKKREEQVQKAGKEYLTKSLPLQSFRTYCNAVARVFSFSFAEHNLPTAWLHTKSCVIRAVALTITPVPISAVPQSTILGNVRDAPLPGAVRLCVDACVWN
jgi:hypothetical protein